jgi:hypothetical protein
MKSAIMTDFIGGRGVREPSPTEKLAPPPLGGSPLTSGTLSFSGYLTAPAAVALGTSTRRPVFTS